MTSSPTLLISLSSHVQEGIQFPPGSTISNRTSCSVPAWEAPPPRSLITGHKESLLMTTPSPATPAARPSMSTSFILASLLRSQSPGVMACITSGRTLQQHDLGEEQRTRNERTFLPATLTPPHRMSPTLPKTARRSQKTMGKLDPEGFVPTHYPLSLIGGVPWA